MATPVRRVAHLHSSLGVYGAEHWTLTLARHLDRDANKVLVLSLGTKPGADTFCLAARAMGLAAEHLAVPGKFNPRAIWLLRRLLLRRGIHILHTHGFKADVIGYFATRATHIALVSTVHGWSADESFRIRAYESLGRLFLRRFDRVYPLSPQLLNDLRARRFHEDRLKLILNAVDVESFDSSFAARRLRRSKDPVRIAFVGRLCQPKGVFDLIQGFARAKFDVPPQLVLVGDGPARDELLALCAHLDLSSKVTLTGAVSSNAVRRIMEDADFLVLPSHSEGIPRVIMEAFAAGLPVIGSEIPGVMQLVKHEDTGLLVPVCDPEALGHAIERLVTDPALGRAMAERARKLVSDRFSARRLAAEFSLEYENVVADRS